MQLLSLYTFSDSFVFFSRCLCYGNAVAIQTKDQAPPFINLTVCFSRPQADFACGHSNFPSGGSVSFLCGLLRAVGGLLGPACFW